MHRLIEAAQKRQAERGLSGQQLAKLMGIDPGTWSNVCSGRRNPGAKVIEGLLRVFPELIPEYLIKVTQKGTGGEEKI